MRVVFKIENSVFKSLGKGITSKTEELILNMSVFYKMLQKKAAKSFSVKGNLHLNIIRFMENKFGQPFKFASN